MENKIFIFIKQCRKVINSSKLLNSLLLGLLGCGSGVLLISTGFIISGYKVGRSWLLIPCAAGIIFSMIHYIYTSKTIHETARLSDNFFKLREGLISFLSFFKSSKTGGFYDLQKQHTSKVISNLNPKQLRRKFPWRILFASIIFIALTGIFLTFNDSLAIAEKKKQAFLTKEKTAEINTFLEKKLEEIKEEMTEEEKEILEKSEISKKIKELKSTENIKDALRQYAELEKKLNLLTSKDSIKEDEAVLNEIGKSLAGESKMKDFSNSLLKKNYNLAANQLGNVAEDIKESGNRNLKKITQDAIKKFNKKHSLIWEASKKMKRAAGKLDLNNSKFKELVNDLEKSTGNMDNALKNCEKNIDKNGSCSDKDKANCQSSYSSVYNNLDKLGNSLKKLALRRAFQEKFCKLQKNLGQCQGYMLSACKSPVGLKPGLGTDPSVNPNLTGSPNKEANTRITGQKNNSGDSRISIEEADSGTGTTGKSAKNKMQGFATQVESFVHRDNVPEPLKEGVKTYFEKVHKVDDN